MSEQSFHHPTEHYLHAKDEIITSYLDGLNENDADIARLIAGDIHISGRPIADSVVIIPVAAVAEAPIITHSIAEYDRQTTAQPFTLILGLNYDGDKIRNDDPNIEACLRNVAVARAAYPQLDIRQSFTQYGSPKIGAIRRDLWNAVLLAKQREGSISADKEIIGLNHDIDVLHLPKQYIGKVQRTMADPLRSLFPGHTRIRHGFDTDHPNTSRLVSWDDFMNDQLDNGYEAAAVIPMSYYAGLGGIRVDQDRYEVGSLIGINDYGELIRTQPLITSPRRMITRLPHHTFAEVWAPESFGTTDDCREPEIVANTADMTAEEVQARLDERVEADVTKFVNRLVGPFAQKMVTSLNESGAIPRPSELYAQLTKDVDRRLNLFVRTTHYILTAKAPSIFTAPSIDIERHREIIEREIVSYSINASYILKHMATLKEDF